MVSNEGLAHPLVYQHPVRKELRNGTPMVFCRGELASCRNKGGTLLKQELTRNPWNEKSHQSHFFVFSDSWWFLVIWYDVGHDVLGMWTLTVDCCLNYPWFLTNLCLHVNVFAVCPWSTCLKMDAILRCESTVGKYLSKTTPNCLLLKTCGSDMPCWSTLISSNMSCMHRTV